MDTRLRFAEFLLDLACAFVIAAVLMAGSVHAQSRGCTMPGQMCIQGNSVGVDVSVRQNGNGVPQTPVGNTMNVAIPIAVTVAAIGVAAVAVPAVGTAAVAGDVMASVGMTAIRGGIIGGIALTTLMNQMGDKGMSVGPDGKVMIATSSVPAGQIDPTSGGWSVGTSFQGMCTRNVCSAQQACLDARGPDWIVDRIVATGPQSAYCYMHSVAGEASQLWASISRQDAYVPPAGAPQPATDAQIQAAIAATPATWPSIYNDMNCGPTLALTNGSTSDPCFAMYSDSRTGFGVSFSTGGSSWTNNGCAVNSATCPSATVTTAPTTDSSTKTNADGSKTTTTNTTTKTTTLSGTSDRTNPVEGQTTTTTSTAVTVTNPDGSTTTTTTTTADQAPPATAANGNQQQKDQTPPTTATLASPDIKLYDKKTKTFGDVLNAFGNTVRASAIGAGVQGFFTVNASGSCPQWVVPATDWTPSIALGPIFCGSSASLAYQIAGYAVLAAAAFAAFAIAFL